MRIFGWLTLLICLGNTADLVHDLAFEGPTVATDAQATTEEPDNAAEHLLMASQHRGNSSTDVAAASLPADFDAIATALALANHTTFSAISSSHHPPPPKPLSFSVPLRI